MRVRFEATEKTSLWNFSGGKKWNAELLAPRIEPNETVFWEVAIGFGEKASYKLDVTCNEK